VGLGASSLQLRKILSVRRGVVGAGVVALGLLACSSALGAEGAPSGGMSQEALLLAQVLLLVVGGRLLGELMYRIGQPSIIGQILAGVLLGPTLLGTVWPQAEATLFPASAEQNAMINGVSQLGILFLLLLAGMETDLGLAWRLRKTAVSVSLSGIAVPFVCGFALGMLVPEALLPDPQKRLVAALFLGTALSISSLKIVATVVREMNFMRRNVGQLIVASAVIDDTAGWVIIAITLGIATTGSVNVPSLAITVIGTLVFLAVCLTVGRRAAFEVIRWTNDSLHSDLPVTTAIITIMGVLALITAGIGVQTVLGAFVAGLLIGQSPILTKQIDEQLRGLTTALFMPVFFGVTGLHTDLRVLADPATLALTAGLVVIASVGKFGGAFLGAKLNGMSRAEALALGFGMNARGSTEVIVATIGLSVGVLDQRLFSVIVTMAIITTLIMPPTLRWALARLPIKPEEQQRLAREEYEEESFLAKLERILLVVDISPSGKLASLLAGHMGGLRNMPVTVLELSGETARPKPVEKPKPKAKDKEGAADGEAPKDKTEDVEPATLERVRASSEEAIAKAKAEDETRENAIHVETRPAANDLAKTLSDEAGKGHDLLYAGLEAADTEAPGFDPRTATMLDAFSHAAIIADARGALARNGDTPLRILVPVSGDIRSLRAMEFAVMIGKAAGARVAALYVQPGEKSQHEAVFERAREIAGHYDVEIRTILRSGRDPELLILSEARSGRYNLIVIGVGRKAGEQLSFGTVADTLFATADRSLVWVATS
jgi:Kef-type K+ transport system membrane component KefB/nucleotide-binding universal stress UspA family protein